MKTIIISLTVAAIVALAVTAQWRAAGTPAYADVVSDEGLSFYMDHMRRQVHKLELAIDAKNKPLAAFYVSKINESIELIKTKFPQYSGIQVAALANAMVPPYMGPLSTAVNGADWAGAATAFNNLLTGGCNGCHTAAQRPFIKIVPDKSNPYNQDFKP